MQQPSRNLPVPTPRMDTVETFHGQVVEDPYQWLEKDSEEVSAWVAAQNAFTRSLLDPISQRGQIRSEIEKLMSVGDLGIPVPRKTPWGTWRYFYLKREGMQNQPTLFVRDGLKGQDKIVLDTSALSADGTTAIDWVFPSPDGRRVALGLSKGGTENSTLYIREVARDGSVKELEDQIDRTRHCSLAWKPDGSGFFYTRYPAEGEVPKGEEQYHRAVFEHTLGQPVEKDEKVFQSKEMTDSPSVDLSPKGRWAVVTVFQGWTKTEVHVRDLQKKGSEFLPLAVGKDASYMPIVADDAIYLMTDDGAARGRLLRVAPDRLAREHWQELIPEGKDTLEDVSLIGGQFIASYLKDASSVLHRYDGKGQHVGEIPLPVLGTARVRGSRQGEEVFVGFSSFAVSSEVYRVALKGDGKGELWQRIQTPIDSDSVRVDQFFATSKDGTKVPYFVVRKANIPLDGRAPAVLAAYGGFNISVVPQFLQGAAVMLERGGVFVQANLRGGGEYGEPWHRAGMLGKKQNVFDDMIAVAEDVAERKVADPKRLAVTGGSNGGLLVGAMIVQRPELFRAAVARVPLMDMLRYQHFLIAKLWVSEYGSSEDPELFPVLRAYSPYHNVKDGVAYPATLITAAEGDSRVHPLHALKMTAALQYATSSNEPILARIESKAGHGAGKPVGKRVDELTDVYSFLMWKLGMLP